MPQCLNCSSELNGTFCSQCGQKASTTRFSIGEILHEFGHAFLHADKGIFSYAAQLLRRPGQLAQEYVVGGKRRRYFSPFVYFLVILTLHGLLAKSPGWFFHHSGLVVVLGFVRAGAQPIQRFGHAELLRHGHQLNAHL